MSMSSIHRSSGSCAHSRLQRRRTVWTAAQASPSSELFITTGKEAGCHVRVDDDASKQAKLLVLRLPQLPGAGGPTMLPKASCYYADATAQQSGLAACLIVRLVGRGCAPPGWGWRRQHSVRAAARRGETAASSDARGLPGQVVRPHQKEAPWRRDRGTSW